MSLINEALKRTRDAAANAGAPAPAVANYRIQSRVESSGTKGNFFATILIAGAILVSVIVLGSRIAQRVQRVQDGFVSSTDTSPTDAPVVETRRTEPATRLTTEPAPVSEAPPKVEITSPAVTVTTAVASTMDAKATEDQIVNKLMDRIKAEQVAAPKTASTDQPKLVLQGITYAKDGSDAMINDQTVHEGDEINGARVVTIENRR